ncbi:MAG TPA: hypothetical protein PKW95_20910 [bacterium]|nr:hypothetical protein [bacterium]
MAAAAEKKQLQGFLDTLRLRQILFDTISSLPNAERKVLIEELRLCILGERRPGISHHLGALAEAWAVYFEALPNPDRMWLIDNLMKDDLPAQ